MTHTAANINHGTVTEFVGWFTSATNFGTSSNTTAPAFGGGFGGGSQWWGAGGGMGFGISNSNWPSSRGKQVYLKKGTPEYDAYVDALAREKELRATRDTYLGVANNRKARKPRPGGWQNTNRYNYNLMALPTNPMLHDVPWAQTQGRL